MPRTRNPYSAEFRDHIIALARSGRSSESLAREFGPCVVTIRSKKIVADLTLDREMLRDVLKRKL